MIRFLFILFFIFCSATTFAAMNEVELARAETLFTSLEKSDNITFIRNDKKHTGVEAADHLRLKLRRGKKKADTLEEFIDKIGSHSFISGEPYLIIVDNETILAKDYLLMLSAHF